MRTSSRKFTSITTVHTLYGYKYILRQYSARATNSAFVFQLPGDYAYYSYYRRSKHAHEYCTVRTRVVRGNVCRDQCEREPEFGGTLQEVCTWQGTGRDSAIQSERKRAIRDETSRAIGVRLLKEQSDAMRSNECFKARREEKTRKLSHWWLGACWRLCGPQQKRALLLLRALVMAATTTTREALIGGGLLSASHLLAQDAVQFVQEGLLTRRERKCSRARDRVSKSIEKCGVRAIDALGYASSPSSPAPQCPSN